MISYKDIFAVLVLALAGVNPAHAQTHEQIIDQCKNSVGRAYVQGCMPQKRDLAACRQAAIPQVRACVVAREQKLAAGKSAPAAPTQDKAEAAAASRDASVLPKAFVAPPRTIADIAAILDNEQPDAAKIAERLADADRTPPNGGAATDIAQFYYDRGNARALLGRNKEALDDALKALEFAKSANDPRQLSRVRQFVGLQYVANGSPKEAVAIWQPLVSGDLPGNRGSMISASYGIALTLVSMGDVSQADTYTRRSMARVQEARGSPHPNWRKAYQIYGLSWEAIADSSRALILEARGQYSDAEQAYRRAEAFRRGSIKTLDEWDYAPPPEQILLGADESRLAIARLEAKQGRLNEAEADARAALLGVLKSQGKYNPQTPKFVTGLASILVEQGRYEEAEKLTRSALDIQRKRGVSDETPTSARILSQLGSILTTERKSTEAAAVYGELDKAVANWEPRSRDLFMLNGSRIAALYSSGQIEAGIAAATEMVKRLTVRLGESNSETAAAHGTLAMGYASAGRTADAIREFKFAIPVLMATARDNAEDDDAGIGARMERLQSFVESYMALLVGDNDPTVGSDTFALADAIRGRSVQQALTASSARAVAKDPQLAELVRTEQDIGKQIGAQLGTLNNVLSLPSGERDDKNVAAINAAITKLRADRLKARQEISRRFPSYADLIDPRPPTVDQIKGTLRDDEAMLSFYFGRTTSFVWAVTKQGPIVFAEVRANASELEGKVRKLREALEPQATMISDIPPFDLDLAYNLYSLLLKPVEKGWKQANSLIVVTNGALGLLPLSLLPTEPATLTEGEPLFSGYRKAAWLARTHAVTSVPSAGALRTLRQLPEASAAREQFIGFGDPIFSKAQAEEAERDVAQPTQIADLATRGLPLKRRSSPQLEGVNSAELALLPRLPDTAEELKSIAAALEADPSKVLNLGVKANEQVVKTTDLSKYKIIVFATHGLVRGELDGLTQPALAMSAPEVAGIEGDGLLTMEEILALKLDADWVVLSACNTGAGSGAGGEAASGLGRAFFYAGTRALLVTNWSVHSQSARELTSDLFRRQADNPRLSRSQALPSYDRINGWPRLSR